MAIEVNIVLGIKNNKGCEQMKHMVQTAEFAGLFPPEYHLNKVISTLSRKELDEYIAGGEFNGAIVLEVMESDSIGQGAIKQWRKANPDCRVILIMDNSKKCSIKTNTLYGIGYYDGLFLDDINILNLAELSKNGREKDRAYAYYGLTNFKLEDKKKPSMPQKDVAPADTGNNQNKDTLKKEDTASVPEVTVENGVREDEIARDIHIENISLQPVSDRPGGEIVNDSDAISDSSVTESNVSDDETVSDDAVGDAGSEITDSEIVNDEISDDSAISDEIANGNDMADIYDETTEEESEYGSSYDEDEEIPFEATAEMEGETLDPSFFEERAQFSTTTSSKSKRRKVREPVIYKSKKSGRRRPLDMILKSDSTIQGYLNKKENEITSRQKRGEREASYMDILFDTAYSSFVSQFEVAFDELAVGKLSLDDFEVKLYPFIESLTASGEDKDQVLSYFESFAMGYDVLEPLLDNPEITEIHVLDANKVRVKQSGQRLDTNVFFYGNGRYDRFCKQLLLRNRLNLTADGTTKVFTDASYSNDFFLQVSVTNKEVSTTKDTELSIRKTLKHKLLLKDLLGQKRLTSVEAATILHYIGSDKGIVVCGPPGSGKTTLMNAMLEHIPDVRNGIVLQYRDELICSTHPELTIQHPVVQTDVVKGVDMVELAKDALLLDEDYIVFGDIKGSEANQFYTASTSGYIVWACVTATGADDALDKISMFMDGNNDTMRVLTDKIGLIVFVDQWNVGGVLVVEGINNGQIKYRKV